MTHLRIGLLALTISFVLVLPAVAQQDWGCGGPCNTYDAMQNGGWQPAPSYTPRSYNHSLGSPSMNQYRYDGSMVGSPTFEQSFQQQRQRDAQIEQRNWQLQNLYQNQKPAACGPAFDPRARAGC